jgi:hypothetical protein
MEKKLNYKNKKGLSTIVVTLILIVLSLVAVGIVWGFVNNMLRKQVSSSEACYGNYNKVTLNEQYTCYETVAGATTTYNLHFSVSMGDVSIDKLIVSVSSGNAVRSYEIDNTLKTVSGLRAIPYIAAPNIKLPDKNAGLTYNATGFSGKIDTIKISPVISGNQCDVSDTISQFEDCRLLV